MSFMNEGTADRAIRVVLGIVFAALATIVSGGAIQAIFWIIAGLAFVTGVVGWCPLYAAFGIRTCPVRTEDTRTMTKVG
jgi:ABC-type transport system involved in Fe-S cluster assembly fused permease/ATPase subunit